MNANKNYVTSYQKNKNYLIDFEGYYDNGNFLFKEVCFYDIDEKSFQNYFVKTKYLNSSTYHWLVKYFHKIPYYYGQTKFSFILNKYFKNNNFFVKGIEKEKFLKKFCLNVINIETLGYCDLKSIEFGCSFHKDCKHCALFKTKKLAYWWHNGYEKDQINK